MPKAETVEPGGFPAKSDDFNFRAGDVVRVRVRENGNSGNIVAKFDAECRGFYTGRPEITTDSARFDPDWVGMGSLLFRPCEAEFEVIGGE